MTKLLWQKLNNTNLRFVNTSGERNESLSAKDT